MNESIQSDLRALLIGQAKASVVQQEQAVQITAMQRDIYKLDVAVRGNGNLGLRQRVVAIEAARDQEIARIKRAGYIFTAICSTVTGLSVALIGLLT